MHRLWELSSLQTGLHRKGRTIVNKNIFLIDKDTKENLGDIDFIPKKEDRIIITRSWKRLEYKVKCIVHCPDENGVLVFAELSDNYYDKIIENIKWK